MSDVRFIAEWEGKPKVLMALPEPDTDWNYMLEEARDQYRRLVEALTGKGIPVILLCHDSESAGDLLSSCDKNNLRLVKAEYNDTWTRDYGPLGVFREERFRLLDFGFNGWGLKFAADKDNLVNLCLHNTGIYPPLTYRNERDFILEGGSVDTDGEGTLLTTTRCLCSPNRNGGKTRGELNEILRERLGVSHVLWLDYGALEGDDTDSHIDTLARLAPGDTILYTGCRNFDDPQFEGLLRMRAQLEMFRTMEGNPFNLIELPLPDPIHDENGQRLPATYSNYLVIGDYVFMPTYSQPANDELACRTVRIAFPDHEVVPVDCRALIRQHGSLHCATMQILI